MFKFKIFVNDALIYNRPSFVRPFYCTCLSLQEKKGECIKDGTLQLELITII